MDFGGKRSDFENLMDNPFCCCGDHKVVHCEVEKFEIIGGDENVKESEKSEDRVVTTSKISEAKYDSPKIFNEDKKVGKLSWFHKKFKSGFEFSVKNIKEHEIEHGSPQQQQLIYRIPYIGRYKCCSFFYKYILQEKIAKQSRLVIIHAPEYQMVQSFMDEVNIKIQQRKFYYNAIF